LGVQADAAALLAQVQQETAGQRDPLDRLAQLRAAVAPLAAEHVAGHALAVRADQRRGAAGRVAQAQRDVFTAVDQSVEGDHPRGRGEAVGEAQRYRHLRPDGCGRQSHGAAPSSGTAGSRIRRINSTAAPGRLETSTSAPYTTAVATPCVAVRPAAPNAHAATPSRGPKPATLAGSPIASSASRVSGTSRDSGAVAPAVRAATRNVARCPSMTTAEASTTPGQLPRPSRPWRMSAAAVRAARAHRDGPRRSSRPSSTTTSPPRTVNP